MEIDNIICLGIESTAHTFGVGIVKGNGNILANERSTYKPMPGFGIVPAEAKQHMLSSRDKVLESALQKAGLSQKNINIMAVSRGPGLPMSLHSGMELAKKISKENNIPLYGVNHCIGHIEIGMLKSGAKDPITVYASGGNTQIIGFVDGKYRIFGETLDLAIGNAFDMFARGAGLDHPGGPKIEALAKQGKYMELPYVVKGMDFSYTGIISQALRLLEKGAKLEDLCFSLQETCFAMLTEVAERALAHTGKSEILLTGGVAANKRLQQMLEIMCNERNATFFAVPMEYAGDNGAMISWEGLLMHGSGSKPVDADTVDINPRWRTDEVDIIWRK